MPLPFIKMHGCGNDYVYVDGFRHQVQDPARLAVRVSDRHKGVGSDGLILVLPSEKAHVRMRMWNADGSESEMCGNGVRCVAKLAYEEGHARHDDMRVEVGRDGKTRVLTLRLIRQGESVTAVTVGMGSPSFVRQDIPMAGEQGVEVLDEQIAIPASRDVYTATCVNVGNPHCVIFLDRDPDDALVLGKGPQLETLRVFPARMNVEFAHVLSPTEIRLRVWERGSGETLACGTGATATVAAAIRTGRIPGPKALVHLKGGDLDIEWDRTQNQLYMTGPAVTVFRGTYLDGGSAVS